MRSSFIAPKGHDHHVTRLVSIGLLPCDRRSEPGAFGLYLLVSRERSCDRHSLRS